jgi:pyruvate kinase
MLGSGSRLDRTFIRRHAQDIIDLKELISKHPNGKFKTPIIAKIEKPEGVK